MSQLSTIGSTIKGIANQALQRIAKSVAIFAKAKIRTPFVNR